MAKILSHDCNHTIFVFCRLTTQMPNEHLSSVLRTARGIYSVSFAKKTCKWGFVLNLVVEERLKGR